MRHLHGNTLIQERICKLKLYRHWKYLIFLFALLLFSYNTVFLQKQVEGTTVDIDLLKHWHRQAAYDSVMLYLNPLYNTWRENKNYEPISKSFKYYTAALNYKGNVSLMDTFDLYESLIKDHHGEALIIKFIDLQRALYNLYSGNWNTSIDLLENICYSQELDQYYPELLAESLNLLSYMYVHERRLDEALKLTTESDKILVREFGENYAGRVISFNNYGLIYDELGLLEKSLEYALKTKKIVFENYGKRHENRAVSLNNLAVKYSDLGEYKKANNVLDEAVELNKLTGREADLAMNYFNKSYNYSRYYDYENCIKMLSLAEALADINENINANMKIKIMVALASTYQDLDNYKMSYHYFQKALSISKATDEVVDSELMNLYAVQRYQEETNDNHTAALEYAFKYTNLAKQIYGHDHEKVANGLFWIAESYEALNQLDSAMALAQKAQDIYNKRNGRHHKYSIEAQIYIAKLHLQNSKIDSASTVIDSLFLSGLSSSNSFELHIPPYDSIVTHPHLINLFELKTLILDQDTTIDRRKSLEAQIQLYEYIALEFERLIQMYGGLKDRDDLKVKSEKVFKKAIAVCYELYSLDQSDQWAQKAFDFSQRARALKMQEIMRNKLAKQNIKLPDSLAQKEIQLKSKYNTLYDLLKSSSKEDSLSYYSIKNECLNAKNEYDKYIKKLEQQFPAYYDLKFNVKNAVISQIQEDLIEDNQTLIQYSWLDSMVFIHVITKNDVSFKKIVLKKEYDKLVVDWYHKMQERNIASLDSIGALIYESFVQPIKHLLTTKDIIVVPDNVLYYINFEALPQSRDDGRQSYMIYDYSIQYTYSPTVALQLKSYSSENKHSLNWLGIVPGFQKETNGTESKKDKYYFAPQPFALQTANNVQKKMKGKLLTEKEANKKNLKQFSASAKILHFGTHAVANDEDPLNSFLVLAGENEGVELLSAAEVFNNELNAYCTVLTACETAVGKIKGGEGMVSLARAFAYAGSPNLIVTLWPVDEEKTSQIIEDFYTNVHEQGLSFNQSLHRAKLKYLTQSKGELKHPFYWSGIIYYGPESSLKKKLPRTLLWGGLIMIAVLVGLGFRRISRRAA